MKAKPAGICVSPCPVVETIRVYFVIKGSRLTEAKECGAAHGGWAYENKTCPRSV